MALEAGPLGGRPRRQFGARYASGDEMAGVIATSAVPLCRNYPFAQPPLLRASEFKGSAETEKIVEPVRRSRHRVELGNDPLQTGAVFAVHVACRETAPIFVAAFVAARLASVLIAATSR